jgi:transposase
MQYYIKANDWKYILAFLRTCKGLHTKNERRLRTFLEAVWYVLRSGCQWRLLPVYYGCWRAIHQRFKSWSDRGIWAALFEHVQVEPDKECTMIDATIVRAHACAAGYGKDSQAQEALGRSKGGFTTKIHALVDALGNPLKFILSPGQRHDITQSEALTEAVRDTIFIADKGYDSNAFIAWLESKGCTPVIPPKKNRRNPRAYDEHLYKERHLIECFFGKIKHYRRIFSRFDKTGGVYLAFLHFAAVFIWLR